MSAAQQQCDTCSQVQPLTEEHFNRDAGTVTGFKYTCRTCRSKSRRGQTEGPEKTDTQEQLENLSDLFAKNSISSMANMLVGGSSVPHAAEIYERLMEAFGGPTGYSRHYMTTFLLAPEGGSVRQKLLNGLLQLGQTVSKSGAADRSLEQYTDEELLDQVKDKLRIANTEKTA